MTFLTESALASRWSCGKSTVRRLRLSGRLPHLRVGGIVRYSVLDVEAFEADHTTPPTLSGLASSNRTFPVQPRRREPAGLRFGGAR